MSNIIARRKSILSERRDFVAVPSRTFLRISPINVLLGATKSSIPLGARSLRENARKKSR